MSKPMASSGTAPDPGGVSLDSEQDQISQNIGAALDLSAGRPDNQLIPMPL